MRTFVLIVLLLLTGCVTTGNTVDKAKMAEGYYMKGLSHLQEKNYEMASVEFNRSLQNDSTFKQSYYGLGIISDYQGKLEDAAKYYQKAIDQDPDYSEAYNALGVVYSKQKKWKEAVKALNKALANKLYTTPHIPYLNLGDLYMEQKEYEKAAEAYRESKRFVNIEWTVIKLGTALMEAGKIKEAISEFQEGVGLAPQNANMRYSLGLAYLKEGNKKSALTEFKKAAELAPKSDLAQKANEYIKILR
ncbi:MAG: tetratricopeptide repeat protein [Nitrospirae bacterium]|nr:tetratricopeptide repeat protein [Nitrospirota bacterium]